MRKHILSYILSAACALSACSTDFFEPDSPPQIPGDDDMLSITVTAYQPVAHDGVSTRAKNEDDVLYTEFEKGDSIGVIVMDASDNILVNNVPFRYDGTNWIFDAEKDGEEKRPYYDAAMKYYIVYFPYTPSADGCTGVDGIKSLERFTHKDNQQSKEDYLYSDIMVWTHEVKEGEKAPKKIEANMWHVYDTFSLVQPKVKWDIVPTDETIEYTTKDETLSDLIIVYAPEKGDPITLKDNDTTLIYRAVDRSYRYLLPENQGGKIKWQYTYRGITFHGERDIPDKASGTRITNSDTGYMGKLPGPKMEFSDFYCSKDTLGQRIGYVLPWDAGEQLKGRHCIGLVAYIGQNQDDFSDYKQTGIKKTKCQGYVISLTDTFSEPFLVTNENGTALPWGSESVANEVFTIPITQSINDWSGYYNQQKIKKYAADHFDNDLTQFPAAFTCEYYGKKVIKNDNGEIEILDTATGLEAPDNTSGWFLPTVHMLYSVNGRDGFVIGGTKYSHIRNDKGEAEIFAIDLLFNDRLKIIKEYANQDPLYNEYLELAGSPTKLYYWGSNHYKSDFSIMTLSGELYSYCPKNGIKVGHYKVTSARAFLAF